MTPLFHIVLVAPDIPGNTGSIGRTCVALGLELILIRPYGFEVTEKALRRAGLDYWKHVQLKEYENFSDFLKGENPSLNDLFFFSAHSQRTYFEAPFGKGAYLIFGSETKGLPQELFENYPSHFFTLPMKSDKIRSLNLANAATAVAYEVLRKIEFY